MRLNITHRAAQRKNRNLANPVTKSPKLVAKPSIAARRGASCGSAESRAAVIPWREIGRASVPGQEAPLVLAQHDREFVIRVGPNVLMSSAAHGSEEALAERALADRADRDKVAALLSGEADGNDTFIEIHAGAGGTESQAWAKLSQRTY